MKSHLSMDLPTTWPPPGLKAMEAEGECWRNMFFSRLTQVMKKTPVLKMEVMLVLAPVFDKGCSSAFTLFSP